MKNLFDLLEEAGKSDSDEAAEERRRQKQERRSRGRALSRLIERSRKVRAPTAASVAEECSDPTKSTDP